MIKLSCLAWLISLSAWALPEWPREVSTQVCGQEREALLTRLGAGPAEILQTAYFDTKELALAARSLNVRLRLKPTEADITVKWRSEQVPTAGVGAECEVDIYRGRTLASCSWVQEIDRSLGLAILSGERKLSEHLNSEQKALLEQQAPELYLNWRQHGPVTVERFKIGNNQGKGKKWRLERWLLPDGSLLVSEVSFSEMNPLSAESLLERMTAHLARVGVGLCPQDEPKTALVLRHFQERP